MKWMIMGETPKNNKLGLILILGGILIAVITLGGYYASQNPRFVAGLFKGSGSTVNVDALEKTLTAAPECAQVSIEVFKAVCAKKDMTPVPSWAGNLDKASRTCVRTSFRDMTFYMMEYRREPIENFKDYDVDLGVIYHACDIVTDLPDINASTTNILNNWYKQRRVDIKANL